MKWFKRALWIALWGMWAIFGWRLAAELPRNLNAPIGRLPSSDLLSTSGFLEDGSAIVGEILPGAVYLPDREQSLHCWRAPTGQLLATAGPFRASRWTPEQPWISLRHGVAAETNLFVDPPNRICNIWNLRSGQHTTVPSGLIRVLDFHPLHRWAAVATDEDSSESRVAVVDLESGVVVKEWSFAKEKTSRWWTVRAGYFADDGNLMIALRSRDHASRLAFLSFFDEPYVRSVPLPRDYSAYQKPRGGRMVAMEREESEENGGVVSEDVLECSTGKVIWTKSRSEDELERFIIRQPLSVLSASGERLYEMTDGLVDIQTNCMVWAPTKDLEEGWPDRSNAQTFWVLEDWGALFTRPKTSRDLRTYALRSLDDGRLIVRLYDSVQFSDAGRLAVTYEGTIHVWPPPINYPLLALCQSILALPLVLPWAMLRWRRNRRLRLAIVAP